MTKGTGGRSPHYRGNDKGGYGNPPTSGQFKSGGKPGPGRKAKQASFVASMKRMFKSTVTIGVDGRKIDVTMMEAMIQRTKKEILTGSPKALEIGFKLAEKFGPEHIKEQDQNDFSTFSRVEKRILRLFFMRAQPLSDRTPPFGRSDDQLVGHYKLYVREDGFMGWERLPDDPKTGAVVEAKQIDPR